MAGKKLKLGFGRRPAQINVEGAFWEELPCIMRDVLEDSELFVALSEVEHEEYERAEKRLPEPKPISSTKRLVHKNLPRIRILIVGFAAGGICYSIVNSLFPIDNGIVSLLTVGLGLSLLIAMTVEVLVGAGVELQVEYAKGEEGNGEFERRVKFFPSIRTVPQLMLLLGMGFGAIILGFASFHIVLSRAWTASYSKGLSALDAIYFAVVTFATVGYGDIIPVSGYAKLLVVAQILISWVAIAFAFSALTPWVISYAQRERDGEREARERTVQRRERIFKEAHLGVYSDDERDAQRLEEAKKRLRAKRKPDGP